MTSPMSLCGWGSPSRCRTHPNRCGTPSRPLSASARGFLPTDMQEREGGKIVTHMGESDSPGTVTGWDLPRRFAHEEPEWAALIGHPGASITPLATELCSRRSRAARACARRVERLRHGSRLGARSVQQHGEGLGAVLRSPAALPHQLRRPARHAGPDLSPDDLVEASTGLSAHEQLRTPVRATTQQPFLLERASPTHRVTTGGHPELPSLQPN